VERKKRLPMVALLDCTFNGTSSLVLIKRIKIMEDKSTPFEDEETGMMIVLFPKNIIELELDNLIEDMRVYKRYYFHDGQLKLENDLPKKVYEFRTKKCYEFIKPMVGEGKIPWISVILEETPGHKIVYIGKQGHEALVGEKYYLFGFDRAQEVEITVFTPMEIIGNYPIPDRKNSYYPNQQKYDIEYRVIREDISLEDFRTVSNYREELAQVERAVLPYNPNFPGEPPEINWQEPYESWRDDLDVDY